jgi:hypothetical protein
MRKKRTLQVSQSCAYLITKAYRVMFPEDARSTKFYRVKCGRAVNILMQAGRLKSGHQMRDAKSNRKVGTICAWLGTQRTLIHPEEIVAVYDVVRDAPMSFFRAARVVRKGGKLDIVAD